MMTREEAIKYAESKKMMLESLIYNDDCKYGNYAMYSTELSFVNAVISALRPVSREKVEKARGTLVVKVSDWDESWRVYCSRCNSLISMGEKGEYDISHCYHFCPMCMAPLTDEAVQMVMERLEALYGE